MHVHTELVAFILRRVISSHIAHSRSGGVYMQITYTLKNNRKPEIGEFDAEKKELHMASGRVLNLAENEGAKLAKKLIYNQVVKMPEMKLVTLSTLTKCKAE